MLVESGRVILSQALIKKYHKSGIEKRLCCDDVLTVEFKFRYKGLTDLGMQLIKGANKVRIRGWIIVEECRMDGGCIGCH